MSEKNDEIEKGLQKKLGEPNTSRSEEEMGILKRLEYFQKGYEIRDKSFVDEFVKELMDENVQIIGTNGLYPGGREWKSGHLAAIEMFRSDWKYWGDVKMYLDHAEIKVEGPFAWATMFGTVTRDTTNDDRMNFKASKERSLQRIQEIAQDKEKPSTQVLYQVIQDASSVLLQYEQGKVFVWPIRMSFGFGDNGEKWILKQIHFSFPGRGFPVVREI